MLSCSLSLFIPLSFTFSPCFPPSLSFVSPLHRFEVPCYVVLVLVCNVFRIRFPFFNTLSAGYQQEHSPCGSCLLSSVSSLQSFAVQAVQGVQGENSLFHISHLATAAKVIGLTTTTATTTTTQRVVMMDYR